MKTAAIASLFLVIYLALSNLAIGVVPSSNNASLHTQANAVFHSGTNALEISMQSNGKPESILVYVSRSNGTVVHFEYVTITNETKMLKIDLSDENAGLFNLRLSGKTLQYSYAFKKSTP